jgi:hypothetical protein
MIVFAKRAGRDGSFGDFLLRQLVTSLEQQRIEFTVTLEDIGDRDIGELDFPVERAFSAGSGAMNP